MSKFKRLSNKEYRDLFKRVLFSTFFHSPEWQDFLEKEFNWLKFEHYLYNNDAILSFGKVGKKMISLPFCEYGGPLPLKKEINAENFKKDVLDKFDNFKIKFHPKMLNYFNEQRTMNSEQSDTSTYWVEDLKNKSEQKLLNSFRKTLRHSIKKAQNHKIEIKKCGNKKEIKKFYNLYLTNLKKKKTVSYPYSVIKFLYNSGSSELLLAVYKKQVIAGSLFLNYEGFVHYFLSASDYKYRNLEANYLILWEKIKDVCGTNKIFDLGAYPKNSSLEIFKRGWGGKEYSILQIGIKKDEEKLRSSKLRNIWGLLPSFVIKKISRYFIKYRI